MEQKGELESSAREPLLLTTLLMESFLPARRQSCELSEGKGERVQTSVRKAYSWPGTDRQTSSRLHPEARRYISECLTLATACVDAQTSGSQTSVRAAGGALCPNPPVCLQGEDD